MASLVLECHWVRLGQPKYQQPPDSRHGREIHSNRMRALAGGIEVEQRCGKLDNDMVVGIVR